MNWDKIYMMPASYNALRKELHDHHPFLWNGVQGAMAWDGPQFVQWMDQACDTVTQFDTDNVDGICKKYLDILRSWRRLAPLHQPHEYNNNNQMEKEVRQAREQNEIAPWLDAPKQDVSDDEAEL